MSVRSAQAITVEFTTRVFATGVATNADSLPTGTLIVNGVDNGASVTVTNSATGRYKAAVTLPTLAIGDVVEININATVSSIIDNQIIWRDTKDIDIGNTGHIITVDTLTTYTGNTPQTGDGFARIGAAGAGLTAVPSFGDFSATQKTSLVTVLETTALTESYAADGVAPTLAQLLFMIYQGTTQISISGLTITGHKLDHSAGMTWTIDSNTIPTSRIRAT